MKIGEVEVRKVPPRVAACQKDHPNHPFAVVNYNGTLNCGECFANELLDTSGGRELLGNLLAGLIKD